MAASNTASLFVTCTSTIATPTAAPMAWRWTCTGRLYVASRVGLQFCDQAGRVNGIISPPQPGWIGPGHLRWARARDPLRDQRPAHLPPPQQTHGVLAGEPPVKPPAPRL